MKKSETDKSQHTLDDFNTTWKDFKCLSIESTAGCKPYKWLGLYTLLFF